MENPIKMDDLGGTTIFGNIQVDLVEIILIYAIMEVDLLAFWRHIGISEAPIFDVGDYWQTKWFDQVGDA